MNSAHHMLTFACANPGSNKQLWLVFFLHEVFRSLIFEFFSRTSGQACNGNEQVIIHGWARNAPSMTLPDGWLIFLRDIFVTKKNRCSILDVGFPVGRNTPYKYIVVNIHYLSTVVNDRSGNQLVMSRKPYVHQEFFPCCI